MKPCVELQSHPPPMQNHCIRVDHLFSLSTLNKVTDLFNEMKEQLQHTTQLNQRAKATQ